MEVKLTMHLFNTSKMGARILYCAIAMLMWWSHELHAQAQSSSTVMDFGAIGDGTTDDSKAFARGWQNVCGGSSSELIIPSGKTFLLKPLKFEGPCNSSNVVVKILGQIVAPDNLSAFDGYPRDNWLQFSNVNDLTVDGGGTGEVDGKGSVWWKTCQPGIKKCPQRPTMVTFHHCNNLKLLNLKLEDSPDNFISLVGSDGVKVSKLHIQAPANSPNTDGIDIVGSTRVFIHDSIVSTGDDCIAINNHAHHVNISHFSCGPGHGISIGSLGDDTVEEVRVWNSTVTGATSGIKIKTWQGGKGFARNIFYENITITNASYPIFIDQYYCPNKSCTVNETSAIQISNVTYKNIIGTSATEAAITFNCSRKFGCQNIQIDQVDLTSALPGKQTYTQCINAQGQSGSTTPNIDCFLT